MLDKQNFNALNPAEKEVLQRVYETQRKPGINPEELSRFFRQNLAIETDVESSTQAVQKTIIDFLKRRGDINGGKVDDVEHFFNRPVSQRKKILWGSEDTPKNSQVALSRRINIIEALQKNRLYPAPVSDHEVLRPIRFERMRLEDKPYPTFQKPGMDPQCDYEFFGTLTPYRFYPVKPNGYLDIQHPDMKVFKDYAQHVADLQRNIGFDFIRADMAHVQTAQATDQPSKNPLEFLAYLKQLVQQQSPYFAIYGESFLSGKKSMDLVQNMNQKKIDVTSGNTDHYPVDTQFIRLIRDKTTASGRDFKEALPVVTHDSDKANQRYLNQNPLATQTRYFISLFQASPGYSMAGYESRPRSTNHAYLFPQSKPFDWGNDQKLLNATQAMRMQYVKMDSGFLSPWRQQWLSSREKGVGGWTWTAPKTNQPEWLMVANTDLTRTKKNVLLSNPFALPPRTPLIAHPVFSTAEQRSPKPLTIEKGQVIIPELKYGESQIYQINKPREKVLVAQRVNYQ